MHASNNFQNLAVPVQIGQPDFGKIELSYVPNKMCIESKSLKFYLWAFRDEGSYCESLAAKVADDILYAISPKEVSVTVYQTARGGIELEATAVRYKN